MPNAERSSNSTREMKIQRVWRLVFSVLLSTLHVNNKTLTTKHRQLYALRFQLYAPAFSFLPSAFI